MRKVFTRSAFIVPATALALLFAVSCDEGPHDAVQDSTEEDTAFVTRSMTVSPPTSPVPKKVADSIWQGDYIERYPNGVVKIRGYIEGGLATGEWMSFYDDGKLWSQGTYHKGLRIGYGVSWHHNGEMSSEGYYNEGKQVGVWKYWSEAGHKEIAKDFGGQMPDTTGSIR